jgi:hypothetical protein
MRDDIWYKYSLVTVYSTLTAIGGSSVFLAYTYPVKRLHGRPISYSKIIESLQTIHSGDWEYSLGAEREVNDVEFEEFLRVTGNGRNLFEF